MPYTWFVDDNVGVDLLQQFLHFVSQAFRGYELGYELKLYPTYKIFQIVQDGKAFLRFSHTNIICYNH